MGEDDSKTLEKLLEKDEKILAKIPARKGTIEIVSILVSCFLAFVGLLLCTQGFFISNWSLIDRILPVADRLELTFAVLFLPLIFCGVFNAKIVFTNKRIIKDNFLWASVEVPSWSDVQGISAKHDMLTLNLKKGDRQLVLKTKDAMRLEEEFRPLMVGAIADNSTV